MSKMFGAGNPLNLLTTPGLIASFKKDKEPAAPAPAATPIPVAAPIAMAAQRSAAANSAEASQIQRDVLGKAGRPKTILSAPDSRYG